ncbi:MAG: hypothetical protein K0R92_1033 [Lachnospiraceae bacterium]|jgi:hypothetical protein|nr:hypothetical protein [Lachnospiraceae bacterium]
MKVKLPLFLLLISLTLITQTACQGKSEGQNTGGTPGLTETEISTEMEDDSPAAEETATSDSTNGKVGADKEQSVISEFETLLSAQDVKLMDVFSFLNENISYVSKINATNILLTLEDLQVKQRLALEEKFYPQEIIKVLQEASLAGKDYNDPNTFTDSAVAELVQETVDSGYKIDQAEGMYFPVINYSIYLPLIDYISDDIKEYFIIMDIESSKTFAKDAALMITWDDVVARALKTEEYLSKYQDSERFAEVEELYQRYLTISLLGLNNTPLFDYETNSMNQDAKSAYETLLSKKKSSEYFSILEEFMKVVKDSNYKLTEEVEQYRNQTLNK